MSHTVDIVELAEEELEEALADLATLLKECVEAGASVGFIDPFPLTQSKAFWRDQVFEDIRAGRRVLLIARANGQLVATVQLVIGMPPNQRHRGEVSKLLVHPDFRRNGLARQLMTAVEALALIHRKSLLTLDTRTGDMAEPLYASLGFEAAGSIPGYCRPPEKDNPALDATTYMYKSL